jgi:hypothetical protein
MAVLNGWVVSGLFGFPRGACAIAENQAVTARLAADSGKSSPKTR